MRYTPVELRHVKLGRTPFGGYKRAEADKLLEDVVESFEEVWRERGELADKMEDVEKSLEVAKQRETLLASTLVAAEKTAAEAIEAAKRHAEIIVAEAHQESRSITRSAQSERERLFAEVRRVETLLRAALGMVEETRNELPSFPPAGEPAPAEAAPPTEPPAQSWPNRQDTREFQAIAPVPEPAPLPPVQEPIDPAPGDEGPWGESRDFAWG
jgi:cell division septum initiation protein DivIVA